MSLLQQLSDNQIALFGCFLAILASFGVMSLTFTVRQMAVGEQSKEKSATPAIPVLPGNRSRNVAALQPERSLRIGHVDCAIQRGRSGRARFSLIGTGLRSINWSSWKLWLQRRQMQSFCFPEFQRS